MRRALDEQVARVALESARAQAAEAAAVASVSAEAATRAAADSAESATRAAADSAEAATRAADDAAEASTRASADSAEAAARVAGDAAAVSSAHGYTDAQILALPAPLLISNNLSDLSSAATARTNMGVAIGVNVAAYDSLLAALSSYIRTLLGATSAVGACDLLFTQGANIASASTTDLSTATGPFVVVTGTTTINSLGTCAAGVLRIVRFNNVLTLTHSVSLILPGAVNYGTVNGEMMAFVSMGGGVWRCLCYNNYNTPPPTGTNTGDQTIALTGDVTGSGTGSFAATIAASAVSTSKVADAAITLAKMANLAQDQFIGRVTASTGVPETATITAAARTVLDDTTVAAMVDTLGGASSTGTGGIARATSPSFTTPILGTPASGNLANCSGFPNQPGRLLKLTVLTSGTGATFTFQASTTSAYVEVVGGGGGGGGASHVASKCGPGAGGGGGGYASKWYSSITGSSTKTYTVGGSANGGSAGANPGTAGNDSTFDNGGTVITAKGGGSGAAGTAVNTATVYAGGAGGAVSTNGDVNGAGQPGQVGVALSGTVGWAGSGGSSIWGCGGASRTAEAAGIAGAGFGSGGSGGLSFGTADKAGGNGAGGCIVVWEFA